MTRVWDLARERDRKLSAWSTVAARTPGKDIKTEVACKMCPRFGKEGQAEDTDLRGVRT